jgi:hypothetical protein
VVSVNGLRIAGGWRESGEVRLVFATTNVNLLPKRPGLKESSKVPFSRALD